MQTHTSASPDKSSTIDQLNSFLRGELSAAETYRLALDRLEQSEHRPTLVQCSRSHEERARLLTEAILGRGGDPSDSSGAWGSLVRMLERGAAAMSESAAVAILEEGEDHGRDDYLRDLDKLEPSARQLIEFAILPEQRRTHDTIWGVQRLVLLRLGGGGAKKEPWSATGAPGLLFYGWSLGQNTSAACSPRVTNLSALPLSRGIITL
jgi:hypothetical protein